MICHDGGGNETWTSVLRDLLEQMQMSMVSDEDLVDRRMSADKIG